MDFLVANMTTNDGFQVSFAIPREVCKAAGWSLSQHGRPVARSRDGMPSGKKSKIQLGAECDLLPKLISPCAWSCG